MSGAEEAQWPETMAGGPTGEGPYDPDDTYHPRRPSGLNPLSLPGPLTLKQKLYILLPQTIGAACIDGLANFGVACAMYRTIHPPKEIRFWPLDQNTIAGDMAVTIFIQGIATFMIASGMVHVDLRRNKIDAFPYPWPDPTIYVHKVSPPAANAPVHSWLWRTFHNEQGLGRGLHFFSGSDVNDIFDFSIPKKQLAKRWFWSAWKGSVLSAFYFVLIWPIAIAITAPIFEHRDLQGTWVPEIIKLIYGFVYGLLQNPLCCLFAMGSEDSVRAHRAEMQRRRFGPDAKPQTLMTTTAERVKGAVGRVRALTVGKASQPDQAELEKATPTTEGEKRPGGGLHRRMSDDYKSSKPRRSVDQARSPTSPDAPSVAAFRQSLDGGPRPVPTTEDAGPGDRRKSFEAALRSGSSTGLNRSGSLKSPAPAEDDVGQETSTAPSPGVASPGGRLRRLTEATETPGSS